jgi:hypothetical protein
MAAEEALRNHASEIAPEHALVAIPRDAMTPWPETEEPSSERLGRPPLTEDPSLAPRVLTERSITADALAGEPAMVRRELCWCVEAALIRLASDWRDQLVGKPQLEQPPRMPVNSRYADTRSVPEPVSTTTVQSR